ncbi:hypothetical protein HmCmsJML041_03124 [Escherichia coli]|nr:hypothetical protein HmCmsJML041_03124 [Escherichia coli]
MIMAKLNYAKGKKFLFGFLAVFFISESVVTRATYARRWDKHKNLTVRCMDRPFFFLFFLDFFF